MDNFLLKDIRNNLLCVDTKNTPANTWHIRWVHGPLIAIREIGSRGTNPYVIYGTKKGIDQIMRIINEEQSKIIETKPNDYFKSTCSTEEINIMYVTGPSSDYISFRNKKENLPSTKVWQSQQTIIDFIIKNYKLKIENSEYPYKNASVLISGPPGCGKTNISLYLAKELNNLTKNKSKLVMNTDLTKIGFTFDEIWKINLNVNSPIILNFNEIDKAFEFANDNKPNVSISKTYFRIAESKTSLNNFLDELSHTSNQITIASTNLPYETLIEKYSTHIRKGRFDQIITIKNDGECIFHS